MMFILCFFVQKFIFEFFFNFIDQFQVNKNKLKMQQNVQSQQFQQINHYSRSCNSNPSKNQQSEQVLNQNLHKNQQINWQAVYVEGKYYLSDQKAFEKLKKIQIEIQKQKQIITNLTITKDNQHKQILDASYKLQNQQKSYYSLNLNEIDQQHENQENQQNYDTKTELNITILQNRKTNAINQLQIEQEKYKDNIRKVQLKKTQIKKKNMEDFQIKTIDLKQYEQKKKKISNSQQDQSHHQINIPQTSMKHKQNFQQSNKNYQENKKSIKINKQQYQSNHQKQKHQIEIQSSSRHIIQITQSQLQQKFSIKNESVRMSLHQNVLHLNGKSGQCNEAAGQIQIQMNNKSRASQSNKESSYKKYSIKKSTVIVPEFNCTLQEIQSRKQQKCQSIKNSEQNKSIKASQNIQKIECSQKQVSYNQGISQKQSKISESNKIPHQKIEKKAQIQQNNQENQELQRNSQMQQVNQNEQNGNNLNQHNIHTKACSKKSSHYQKQLNKQAIYESRVNDKQSSISSKKQCISSKKPKSHNQKIDLMYIPHAPKESNKSLKKTDKSIQWSQIDVSNYGKSIIDQSRVDNAQETYITNNNNIDFIKKIEINKINMKKNKAVIQLAPIMNADKQKSVKSNISNIPDNTKAGKQKQASVQFNIGKPQRSFVIRSRQGSVQEKVQRYDKFQRDHSLNQKSLKDGKTSTLKPIEKLEQLGIENIDKHSKKTVSYRSRKSNIQSVTSNINSNNAISKSKAISVRQVKQGSLKSGQKAIEKQSSEYFENPLSQIEGTKILVSKGQIIQLHQQIKLLQTKLCKIQQKQQHMIKQKHLQFKKTQSEALKLQKQVQMIKLNQQKQQKDQIYKQIQVQQYQIKIDEKQKEKILLQQQIKIQPTQIQTQAFNLQKQKVQNQFNQQKGKLMDEISRLKHIIRDLQIEKIKSIDHDKTIDQNHINLTKMVQQNQLNTQDFGHIVHQNTISKTQDQRQQSQLSRFNRLVQNSQKSSKSPYGKIVKNNSPNKNQSRVFDTEDDKKSSKFRISLSKKVSINSQQVLGSNNNDFTNTPRQTTTNDIKDDQLPFKPNKPNQLLTSSKSSEFQQQLLSYPRSSITKQQVLQKFNRTNRQFHNFIQSSRIINQTNSSISNLSQTHHLLNRSNQSSKMFTPETVKANIDEFNPEKLNNNHNHNTNNMQNQSFTRMVNEFKSNQEIQEKQNENEQEQEIPQIQLNFIKTPDLPSTPTVQMNQNQLFQLSKKTFGAFQIILSPQDHDFTMKKYKNCIILTKGHDTVLWHYNGKFYMGGWKNKQNGEGQKTGQGLQMIPDKHIYKGQFLNGKKHGTGIMKSQNGNLYDGQWIEGIKNGQGIFYDATTKVVYQGEWKDGKKNGFGLLKFSQKQFYHGTFVKSVKDGFGYEKFVNGDKYKGEYRKGKFHGKGRYTWANGSVYEGDFNEGMRHGNGGWKSAKKQGDVYVGMYKNDKKAGTGRYIWSNGCIYEGSFAEDVKHGKGKLIYTDGRQIKGVWEQGALLQAIQQNKKQRDQDDPLRKTMKHLGLNSTQKTVYA